MSSQEDQEDQAYRNDFTPQKPAKIAKRLSKVAERTGVDFGLYVLKLLSRRLQRNDGDSNDDVMSSTGFVTFLDLGTVTSVASIRLTHKPNTMTVGNAPEPR